MATYTVTNTFTADTTAVASEVNQNFTDVLTALNDFDASNIDDTTTVPLGSISGLTVTQLAAATIVLEAEGIENNDNDTTWPTSAAVRDYVDEQNKNAIGAGVSKSVSTNYTAATSGTLVVQVSIVHATGGNRFVTVKSDASATPSTVVGKCGWHDNIGFLNTTTQFGTITVPIVKAKKYRVDVTAGATATSIIFYPNQ